MVYIIEMWCDGACKNNGGYDPRKPVVAGAGLYYPRGKDPEQYRTIASNNNQGNPSATSNRAELHGVIMALETALEVISGLRRNPWVEVTIHMDSKYVVNALTQWRFRWESNGWRNAKGQPVANQDLITKAIRLDEEIEDYGGQVIYQHVPREENQDADELANYGCQEALDMWNSRSRY